MDFLSDYFYIIILIVGAIAQWLKSRSETTDASPYEHEEPHYDPDVLEELEREAERRNPSPASPPPLPSGGGSLPGVGRSAVPDLRRKVNAPPVPAAAYLDSSDESVRQQSLIDKAREFKSAKRARVVKEPKGFGAKPAVPIAPGGSLKSRLHNRRELRSAFVLKEILEKPIGLR
jgi:hypothetical protein